MWFLPIFCPHLKTFGTDFRPECGLSGSPEPSVCMGSGLPDQVDLLTSSQSAGTDAGSRAEAASALALRRRSSPRSPADAQRVTTMTLRERDAVPLNGCWLLDATENVLIGAGAPNTLVQQGYDGSLYTADLADHEYCHWGELTLADADRCLAYRARSVSAVVGDLWCASNPDPSSSISYKARDFFSHLVAQTSANLSGGGLALAAGPFAGNGWEPGVQGFFEAVGSMVAPVQHTSLSCPNCGTKPIRSSNRHSEKVGRPSRMRRAPNHLALERPEVFVRVEEHRHAND